MNRYFFLLFLLCLFSFDLSAQYNQPQNKIWAFGNHAGYNFNTNTAFSTQINANECSESVCDANGNLLFYTDGNTVWDAGNNPMPSANPLFPPALANLTQSTAQGALVIPFPGNSNRYYLFSLTAQESANNAGGKLYYSVIDMSLNNGMGDVVPGLAHIAADTGLSEHMIAIPSCNSVWILVHGRTTPTFKAYRIDQNGFNATPVLSTAGVTGFAPPGISGYQGNNFHIVGQMTVSADYKQIAATYFRGNYVELYGFNNTTGQVTARGVVDSVNDSYGFYGVSFSPDGNRLYVSNCAANIALKAFNQYNLALPTIIQIRNSKVYLGACNASITQLQTGPDGKIYFNGGYISKMGSISFPNLLGTACGFNPQAVNLISGTNTFASFHNTIMQPILLSNDTIALRWKDTSVCPGTTVQISARSGGSDYVWSNGSGGSAISVNTPGTYWVSYIKNCTLYTDTLVIRSNTARLDLGPDTLVCNSFYLYPKITGTASEIRWQDGSTRNFYPVAESGPYKMEAIISGCPLSDSVYVDMISLYQDLGKDMFFCAEEAIRVPLTVQVPNQASVLWSNGSTGNLIIATQPGTYGVTVSHPVCGSFYTEVNINSTLCDCNIMLPNAFSPNGDGRNDYWSPQKPLDCNIETYILRIYNRWGQCVFFSENINHQWDGTFEGKPAPQGIYIYELSLYKGKSLQRFYQKGDITLLR
ncbi:gliding motility-associated C-terminal domain-containing protein [Edaphocola flava]|uniref:gliding motility-associated C-terminal domain-containing protein n=1 Tax=Edaphocola flava TaxID=2499629 RepID=UPI00100B2A9E|nr:gliding motility-associated C-terminal domain-containing protein [Edaphocola flava]